MMRLRRRVDSIVKERRLRAWAQAITQLREICCHPSLVLDDYTGTSGKLDMLLDMLPEAIAKGRRVLLFSAFTSMLKNFAASWMMRVMKRWPGWRHARTAPRRDGGAVQRVGQPWILKGRLAAWSEPERARTHYDPHGIRRRKIRQPTAHTASGRRARWR